MTLWVLVHYREFVGMFSSEDKVKEFIELHKHWGNGWDWWEEGVK